MGWISSRDTKSVIIPWGSHPFPSRTRKLSPAGPIVLHAKVCGRVGRRRHKNQRPIMEAWSALSFLVQNVVEVVSVGWWPTSPDLKTRGCPHFSRLLREVGLF